MVGSTRIKESTASVPRSIPTVPKVDAVRTLRSPALPPGGQGNAEAGCRWPAVAVPSR